MTKLEKLAQAITTGKKLPVPKRTAAQQAASATAPVDAALAKIDAQYPVLPDALRVENRKPQTPEQKAKVEAAMAKAPKTEVDQAALRRLHREQDKEKARVRVEKMKAKQAGKTTEVPPTGKAALAAIANRVSLITPKAENGDSRLVKAAIENGHPVKKLPTGARADAKAAPTKAKKAPSKAPKAAKKASNGSGKSTKLALIVDLLKRKQGCTTADVLAATGWPAVSMPQQAKAAGLKLVKVKVKGQPTCYRAG